MKLSNTSNYFRFPKCFNNFITMIIIKAPINTEGNLIIIAYAEYTVIKN